MILVRCFHSFAAAEAYEPAMTALNLMSPRPDPFSSPAYLQAFHQEEMSSSPAPELWLMLMFRGERLIGYAALKRSVTRVLGLRAAKLDWLTDHRVPSPQIVSMADDLGPVSTALCNYLLSRSGDWSLLEFQQQPPEGALATGLKRALGSAHRLRSWPNLTLWSIPIQGLDLSRYHSALSPHFRSNLSRQMRRLFAGGAVSVIEGNGESVLSELMIHYRKIVQASWKAQASGAGPLPSAPPALLSVAAMAMPLTVQLLLLDGVPVAGLVSGDHAGATYALEIVYDDGQAALAPGMAMLFFGLQRAMRIGMTRFELMGGYGYYKQRWLGQPTQTQSLQVYQRGSAWDCRRAVGDAARWWYRAPPTVVVDHNPSRRKVLAGGDTGVGGGVEAVRVPVDAGRVFPEDRLLALRESAGVHWQSGAELVAAMPFSLDPQKARAPVRRRAALASPTAPFA